MLTLTEWRRPPAPTPLLVHDLVRDDAQHAGYRAFARVAEHRRDDWAAEHGWALDTACRRPVIGLLLPMLVDAAALARLGQHRGQPGMATAYHALLVIGGAAATRWYRWNRRLTTGPMDEML